MRLESLTINTGRQAPNTCMRSNAPFVLKSTGRLRIVHGIEQLRLRPLILSYLVIDIRQEIRIDSRASARHKNGSSLIHVFVQNLFAPIANQVQFVAEL